MRCSIMQEHDGASWRFVGKLVIEQFLLQGILELGQHLCHHRLAMSDAQHRHVGYLTVTVRALQALHTMQG